MGEVEGRVGRSTDEFNGTRDFWKRLVYDLFEFDFFVIQVIQSQSLSCTSFSKLDRPWRIIPIQRLKVLAHGMDYSKGLIPRYWEFLEHLRYPRDLILYALNDAWIWALLGQLPGFGIRRPWLVVLRRRQRGFGFLWSRRHLWRCLLRREDSPCLAEVMQVLIERVIVWEYFWRLNVAVGREQRRIQSRQLKNVKIPGNQKNWRLRR